MSSRRAYSLFQTISQRRSSKNLLSSSICQHCRTVLAIQQANSSIYSTATTRSFSTSLQFHKKSSVSKKSSKSSPDPHPSKVDQHIPDNKATRNRDAEVDPFDFSELETSISKIIDRLKDSLSRTRDAGRVTSTMIEGFPVELNIKHPDQSQPRGKSASAHHEQARLGDIASVVPKGGRTMQVYAAEEGHVKALLSAIQASEHSLTPEIDQHNPLLLIVPVPPVTAETRAQAAVEAKKCLDQANLDVRNARAAAHKVNKKLQGNKAVGTDDARKAHDEMEKVVRKGNDEVKKVYEAALKSLQQ